MPITTDVPVRNEISLTIGVLRVVLTVVEGRGGVLAPPVGKRAIMYEHMVVAAIWCYLDRCPNVLQQLEPEDLRTSDAGKVFESL